MYGFQGEMFFEYSAEQQLAVMSLQLLVDLVVVVVQPHGHEDDGPEE